MQQHTHASPSPAVPPPSSAVATAEAARWQHAIRTFLGDLDDLVACGRIGPDARSVVRWTLTRTIPLMERAAEGRPADDAHGRAPS